MRIEITRNDLPRLIMALLIALAVIGAGYFIYWASVQSSRADRCAKNCGQYRSNVIDGQCHCSTDYGWLKSGRVESTLSLIKRDCKKAKRR